MFHVQSLQQMVRRVMAPVETWALRTVSAAFGLLCRCKLLSDTEFYPIETEIETGFHIMYNLH